MRVLFFGTPEFAVPTLDALVDARHEVLAVVAQPDRPSGRGQKVQSPPTVVRARELGIAVRQPKALKGGPFLEWFLGVQIDVAVVVAFGRVLPIPYLDHPRWGCINVHASLLPKFRGAAPIQWSIINGERETGCCTMRLEEGLDTGPLYSSRSTPIGPDETSGELFGRLAPMGAELLVGTLAVLGEREPVRQDHRMATLARPLQRDDGKIEWSKGARAIHDLVRGTNPWPGAFTGFHGARLKIHRTRVDDESGPAGMFLGGAVVGAGVGAVELVEVQLPGKRRQSGKDFVNGAHVAPGTTFGEVTETP